MTSPETVVRSSMSSRSKPSGEATHGPIGVNVSKLLPRVNWRSGVSSCARRPLTSLTAVIPADRLGARFVARAVGPPADHHGDLALVVGRVSSRGSRSAPRARSSDEPNLAKTTGTSGGSRFDSAACAR